MNANVVDPAVAEVFSTYAQPSPMSGVVLALLLTAGVAFMAWVWSRP